MITSIDYCREENKEDIEGMGESESEGVYWDGLDFQINFALKRSFINLKRNLMEKKIQVE